ncbi:MAG: hypothetical protein K9M49_08265 [Candidatus Marinimicrobia bacterium]|nr:hypothetical protein [Candidatus Neomarinimicrobiota bacterium]MCF7850979.1 hypothetical protein [Candidatus Neomarinimicrobiota bacterium]MCF7905132.1 hypothetical protein [Candidatus Neomarinimicrobiota bacterium]
MNSRQTLLIIGLAVLVVTGCAPRSVPYDLPSVETIEQPQWVQDASGKEDSVFLVIKVELRDNTEMTQAIQKAQSELSEHLREEIEDLLLRFYEESKDPDPETVIFKKLAALPQTLETIMTLITVEDAWERSGQVAVLCGFDYLEVATVIMEDMHIEDKTFLTRFKDHMDAIANKHQ